MRTARLSLLALAVSAFAPAFADSRLPPSQTMRMATVRVYNPNGPAMLGGGGHAFGPGASGVVFPVLNGLINLSDSRGANGFSLVQTAPNYTYGLGLNSGYPGWFATAVGNRFGYTTHSPDGIGASTTLSSWYRTNVASNYDGVALGAISCANGGSACTGAGSLAAQASYGFAGSATAGSLGAPATYTVAFTSPTAYTVTSPVNGVIGSGTIAAANSATSSYPSTGSSPEANFKITQASSGALFAAGDTFSILTYGPQNPAGRLTTDTADLKMNNGSDGQYSPVAAPETAVFFLDDTNDPAYSYFTGPTCGSGPVWTSIANVAPCATIQNIAASLIALTNAGKVVFLANGTPRGIGFAQNQKLTVASNAVTANPTTALALSSTFLEDGRDFTTNGVSTPIPGVIASNGAVYTKVASAPAAGQYSVNNATGVYTFNSSDATVANGTSVYLTYAAVASGAPGVYRGCVHQWLSSSAANFSCNGTTFNVPGALAISPLVVSVDTWDAMIDTAGSNYTDTTCNTSNCYNKIGTLFDGLHPSIYGGDLVGEGPFATAYNSIYGSAPDLTQSPIVNNFYAAKGTNSQTVFIGTLPQSMNLNNVSGNAIPALAVTAGAVVGIDNGSGTIVGSGISGTINHTSGAYSVTFTTAPSSTAYLIFAADNTNANGAASTATGSAANNNGFDILANPLLDPANTVNQAAACTGTTGLSYLPTPWTCTASNYSGLTLALSETTSPAGYPQMTLTISGVATTAGNIFFSNVVDLPATRINPSNPDILKASIVSSILPNSGHLYGILGAYPYANVTSSANFTRPGAYSSGAAIIYTNQTGQGAGSSGNVAFSDLDLTVSGNSSGIFQEQVGMPISTQGMTINQATYRFTVSWNTGPVSAIVNFSQAALRIRGN